MTFQPKSFLHLLAGIAGGTVAIGLAGCVAFAGATVIQTPIVTSAPRGFLLKSVVAILEPEGVRFHGAVCRRTSLPAPVRIRVDRIDAAGQVLTSASRTLSGLRGPERHCTFFDVPTVGSPRSGESARVCAQRDEGPCPAVAKPAGD